MPSSLSTLLLHAPPARPPPTPLHPQHPSATPQLGRSSWSPWTWAQCSWTCVHAATAGRRRCCATWSSSGQTARPSTSPARPSPQRPARAARPSPGCGGRPASTSRPGGRGRRHRRKRSSCCSSSSNDCTCQSRRPVEAQALRQALPRSRSSWGRVQLRWLPLPAALPQPQQQPLRPRPQGPLAGRQPQQPRCRGRHPKPPGLRGRA